MNNMDCINDLRYELIDFLREVDVLSEGIYQSLVLKYGKYLVDSVIDNMDDNDNLLKYDFYVSMKLEEFYSKSVDSFELYMRDIKKITKFKASDNMKYTIELDNVFQKLDNLFREIGYSKEIKKLPIDKRIKYYLNTCNDVERLKQINNLYVEYINIRNKIILGNLYFVISIANLYGKNSDNILELIQSGNEGLIKAIEKYNPYMNVSFSTYAYYWVKNYVISSLRGYYTCLTIPSGIETLSQKISTAKKKIKEKINREPTDLEIAEYLKTSLFKIYEVRDAYSEVVPLSSLCEEEFETGKCDLLIDYDDYIEPEISSSELIERVRNCLTDSEFLVISMRYGLDDDVVHTYSDIGDELNMTGENVRTIHSKALQKIRRKFNKNKI